MDRLSASALDAINTILKNGGNPVITLADIHRLTSDVVSLINKEDRVRMALGSVACGNSKSYCEAMYPERFKS